METQSGQEPTPGSQEQAGLNTATPATTGGQEPQVFDAAYVKTLRQEAAQWRKQAQEAAAKVQTFEAQQMSEAERLQAQAKTAQEQAQAARQELQQARAEVAISRAAAALGVDPRKLAKLVTVEFDADGQPVNVDQAAAAVADQIDRGDGAVGVRDRREIVDEVGHRVAARGPGRTGPRPERPTTRRQQGRTRRRG